MSTILVTGFEPFTPYKVNPTEELARALDGVHVGRAVVRGAVLPVHHAEAAPRVRGLLDTVRPDTVLHLGLAGGRARIALERVAVNVMDYTVPDNAGCQKTDEACVPAGPAAYFATLPLRAILARLTDAGIPAYISDTAGTYLCNQTLYTTLHAVSGGADAPRVGFMHMPLLPSMVAASGLDQPSMDLGLMRRAVELALDVLAAD
ncbi:MAG: pyroglutamyl-peptidase I [Candidatus Rokubacteria bacterium]|nr:pyroglutamyl-peptidase I [Candidatus Rokubacteria bacterium]